MRLILFALLTLSIACANTKNSQKEISVIPKPNTIKCNSGKFVPTKNISINFTNPALDKTSKIFTSQIEAYSQFRVREDSKTKITLNLINELEKSTYKLDISKNIISIDAGSVQDIFYGLQTVLQLLINYEQNKDEISFLEITDSPRFGWRGVMLDESRHFFGVEKVKQLLDLMAIHKLNVFHWHLTDDPGWRIDIKQYPKLTSVGGLGNDMNPDAPAKFYTQKEIKEIVEYARDRFIEVIPEIDMPGHAKAANRAYPEFSGGGSKSHPEFTFNPGYTGTYAYLTNILREVTELFPSKYIHLGGDEVHFGNENWNYNEHVQKLMKEENLENLKEVERYFVQRMADSIKSLNKTVVGWDEVVDLDLNNDNTLVMWWRHDKTQTLKNALDKGFQTVLCPRIPLYFDFVQDDKHKWGRKWKDAFSTLKLTYNFPPDTLPGFLPNEKLISGIQANIWTERIQNNKRLDFMTHPRLSALAEAAWTKKENKSFSDFEGRLKNMLSFLKSQDIYYYNYFNPDESPEPVGVDKKKQIE